MNPYRTRTKSERKEDARNRYLAAKAQSEGSMTAIDLVRQALDTPELRTLPLRELLSNEPDVVLRSGTTRTARSEKAVEAALQRLAHVTRSSGGGTKTAARTIGWLLDERHPERLTAYLDVSGAAGTRDEAPWWGYPTAPPPTGLALDVDVPLRAVPAAAELMDASKIHKLRSMRSVLRGTGLEHSRRLDPMHCAAWGHRGVASPTAQWASRRSLRRNGVDPSKRTTETALASALGPSNRAVTLDVLQVLHEQSTLTLQQLAAWTGHTGLASKDSSHVRRLFDAELIDVGVVGIDPLASDPTTRALWLVRLTRERGKLARALGALTVTERWLVTGGKPPLKSSASDRHDVLVAELLLRIAETCAGVQLVLGERHANAATLGARYAAEVPTHFGESAIQMSEPLARRNGDGLVVRGDGVSIVLEVEAGSDSLATKRKIEAKVRSWLEVFRWLPQGDETFVLFVAAGRDKATTAKLASMIEGLVQESGATLGWMQRFGVTTWDDLFPEEGRVSEAFPRLQVRTIDQGADHRARAFSRLLGRTEVLNRDWKCGIATGIGSPEVAFSRWQTIARLLGVPHWLKRDARGVELPSPVDLKQLPVLAATGEPTLPGIARPTVAGARSTAASAPTRYDLWPIAGPS